MLTNKPTIVRVFGAHVVGICSISHLQNTCIGGSKMDVPSELYLCSDSRFSCADVKTSIMVSIGKYECTRNDRSQKLSDICLWNVVFLFCVSWDPPHHTVFDPSSENSGSVQRASVSARYDITSGLQEQLQFVSR